MTSPVLEVSNIRKTFPGVVANDAVDFTLMKGEIHCLLGENGAGKSTLMNVVFGLYQPDNGTIKVNGQEVSFENSRDAIAAGIGMVHQHFQLIPVFTVAENVILGSETTKGKLLDMEAARTLILDLGKKYGLHVDPDAKVGDLSVGEQQRVELIKALYREADILILDEPTAVLTPGEVDDFFEVVQSLVKQGKSIIFITHKLREVLSVADKITVMRAGTVVGTAEPETSTQQSLANLMVGHDVILQVDKTPAEPGKTALVVTGLQVSDTRGLPAVAGIDLQVRAGEIFGIAGVQGNGQRELVEALAGMHKIDRGRVEMLGKDVTTMSPRQISELGVAHVPEDREKHGVVGEYPIYDNLVLNRYFKAPFVKRGVRQMGAVRAEAERLIEMFDVRTPSMDTLTSSLSGGNRQKTIIARELSQDPKLMLVAQPTRGLDVGSIQFIHEQIIALRDSGVAVLLVSAELDEIMSLSDRIGVMYQGKMVGTVDGEDVTRETLGILMAGGTVQQDSAEDDRVEDDRVEGETDE